MKYGASLPGALFSITRSGGGVGEKYGGSPDKRNVIISH